MKKKQLSSKDKSAKVSPSTEKSFSTLIEETAKLLRTQVSPKKRKTHVVSSSDLSASFKNSIEQIALLLRREIRESKKHKKRTFRIKN
jgi:hypothetical protein